MTHSVIDASALVTYLRGEMGCQVVTAFLADPDRTCYCHSVNLCEVYYDECRVSNTTRAKQVVDDLLDVGLIERPDMSRPFWQSVGDLKSRGRISLADCFGLALARELGGDLVTADHHEFDPIVPLGVAPITFIR